MTANKKSAKYYVVWKGRTPGVYASWDACKREIAGIKGALYMAFPDRKDAEKAFRFGVASGSATAFRSDLCKKSDVEALLDQVQLHPLHEEDVTR